MEKLKREKHQKGLLHKADIALTAKDLFNEMMEEISDPSNFREWIEKYNLTPDLEAELKKIVAKEITKRSREDG